MLLYPSLHYSTQLFLRCPLLYRDSNEIERLTRVWRYLTVLTAFHFSDSEYRLFQYGITVKMWQIAITFSFVC